MKRIILLISTFISTLMTTGCLCLNHRDQTGQDPVAFAWDDQVVTSIERVLRIIYGMEGSLDVSLISSNEAHENFISSWRNEYPQFTPEEVERDLIFAVNYSGNTNWFWFKQGRLSAADNAQGEYQTFLFIRGEFESEDPVEFSYKNCSFEYRAPDEVRYLGYELTYFEHPGPSFDS